MNDTPLQGGCCRLSSICHAQFAQNTVDEWVNELLGAKQLAARYGLGDIGETEYKSTAKYGFMEVLRRVLGEEFGAYET